MTYKLKVLRTEENPKYGEELNKWNEDNNRNRNYALSNGNPPQPELITNAIEVELTPEQFEAVKKAVIETFK